MFPIRDHNPSGRTPYVTYALIALNILAFASYWPLMDDPRALNAFYSDWAMVPRFVTDQGRYYSVFTSMFLHGGLMHIAGNMLFLWVFGDNIEDELGHVTYLFFYLAAGAGAGIAHVVSAPNSLVPTVGASGAIAGVMGGYLLLYPKAKVDVLLFFIIIFRIIPIPSWIVLGLWFGLQIFNGVGSDPDGGGVAYWAHAGGFIIGAILILPVFLRRGGRRFWVQTDGHPPHPEAEYSFVQSRIPIVRRRK